MCRHLAYLGPPATLAAVLVDPPHSLFRQSWEPQQQTSGVVNADGFGVGWYDPARRHEPARYRSTRPIWADANFASFSGLVAAPALLAAVRSATPPLPLEESSTPPFHDGPWLFSHNGCIDGFREGHAGALRRGLSDRRASGIVGASDSEVLFALLLDYLDAGATAVEAAARTVTSVRALAPGRLNLLLTDGRTIVATRHGDSLFVRDDRVNGSVTVASEPDAVSEQWSEVSEGMVIEACPGMLSCQPIDELVGDL